VPYESWFPMQVLRNLCALNKWPAIAKSSHEMVYKSSKVPSA